MLQVQVLPEECFGKLSIYFNGAEFVFSKQSRACRGVDSTRLRLAHHRSEFRGKQLEGLVGCGSYILLDVPMNLYIQG